MGGHACTSNNRRRLVRNGRTLSRLWLKCHLGGQHDFDAIYRSLTHGRPIVNGYSGYYPPFYLPFVSAMSYASVLRAAGNRTRSVDRHRRESIGERCGHVRGDPSSDGRRLASGQRRPLVDVRAASARASRRSPGRRSPDQECLGESSQRRRRTNDRRTHRHRLERRSQSDRRRGSRNRSRQRAIDRWNRVGHGCFFLWVSPRPRDRRVVRSG